MPIIRVTKKQIEAANKVREAALKKGDDFRLHEERRHGFEDAARAHETILQNEPKAAVTLQEEPTHMSCLGATFTLTPRSPSCVTTPKNCAYLYCFGADFWAGSPGNFSSLYASNRFLFTLPFAASPKTTLTASVGIFQSAKMAKTIRVLHQNR